MTPTTAAPAGLSPAAAAAQAAQTGVPVEVTSATTPTQRTLANPDGTLTVTSSAQPVRVKRNGSWVGLDPTLRANPDGTYSPTASSNQLVVSGGGTTSLATMHNLAATLSIAWPTSLPTPTISGANALYPSVLPGVDLQVTATDQGGLRDVLIVHSAAAAANPALSTIQLAIATAGTVVTADAAGNLAATGPTGLVLFRAPAARMWDSTTASAPPSGAAAPGAPTTQPPSSPAGPGNGAQIASVGVHATTDAITLTPDHTMLTAPTTQWPVFIDPSWNPNSAAGSRSHWTYVASAWPDQSYYDVNDYARLGVSYDSPHYTARSFFQMAIPAQLWGTHIISATFQTQQVWSASASASSYIDVYHTCAISSATNWNNQPCRNNLINKQNIGPDWNANQTPNPIEEDFDVTSEIAAAAASHWSSDTLGLYNENETSTDGWKKFANNPTVAVTYNSVPNLPSYLTTNPGTRCLGDGQGHYDQVGNTTVTLSATVSDPDGTQTQIQANFHVVDQTTLAQLPISPVTVSNNRIASVTLATSQLVDGRTYAWSVQAYDGKDSSQFTSPCYFTVNHQQPGQPVITSTTYPKNDLGPAARTPGTFTFNPDPNAETPAGYIYAFNVVPTVIAGRKSATTGGQYVAATNGSATKQLVPPRVGRNTLYAYAIDAAGNASSLPAEYPFDTAPLATPDPAGDLTGDGQPDLILPGNTTHPGLWLYKATDTAGHLNTRGQQIGSNGTGAVTPASTSNWTGSATSTADFDGDGVQDILVKLPTPPSNGANTEVLLGHGDGAPLQTDANNLLPIMLPRADGTITSYQTVDQVTPATDLSGMPFPDLYAVIGHNLYLYTPVWAPLGTYNTNPECLSGPSGSGCDTIGDWSTQTITSAPASIGPALFARNTTTGELDLWTGNTNTSIPAAGVGSVKTVYTTSGWTATATPTIAGLDINLDNRPDLWAATSAGNLTAYLSNTSTNAFTTPINNGTPLWTGIDWGPSNLVDALSGLTKIVVGDLNNDGKNDLIGLDAGSNVYFIPNNGTGTINWGTTTTVDAASGFVDIAVGDLNNDGKNDLIGLDAGSNVYDIPNNGTGTINWGRTTTVDAVSGFADIAVGDLNNDGKNDLVGRTSSTDIFDIPNNATNGINWGPSVLIDGQSFFTDISVGDLNDDGKNDLVGLGGSSNVYDIPNNGTGTIDWGNTSTVDAISGFVDIAVGDLNNDGKRDLVGLTPPSNGGNVYDIPNNS
jgi:hypothetical protein